MALAAIMAVLALPLPRAAAATRRHGGAGATGSPAPSDTIVVGSANFQENVVLADIYAEALKAKGVKVTTKLNIGSREAYIPALKDGSIDLIPEYSGVLLQYFDKTATAVGPDDVFAALQKALPADADRAGQVRGRGQGRHRGHQGHRRQVPPHLDRRPGRGGRQADPRRSAGVQDPSGRHPGLEEELRRGVQAATRRSTPAGR